MHRFLDVKMHHWTPCTLTLQVKEDIHHKWLTSLHSDVRVKVKHSLWKALAVPEPSQGQANEVRAMNVLCQNLQFFTMDF